jgi:transposase
MVAMQGNFIPVQRDQLLLLPPDMRQWLPEDHLVHFLLRTLDCLDLPDHEFHVRQVPGGKAAYHPKMMLALLIYAYSTGLRSSRKIEQATYDCVSFRVLTADQHPDHDTICTFRRNNGKLLQRVHLELLLLAREMDILKFGQISVDGTLVKASASKKRNTEYDRLRWLRVALRKKIRDAMTEAERADQRNEPTGQSIPLELTNKSTFDQKLNEARKTLKRQARERYVEQEQQRESRKQHNDDRRKQGRLGPGRRTPDRTYKDDQPRDKECVNLTDSDSKVMKKSSNGAFEQSYNGQLAVDADGSQLILSGYVTNHRNDLNEMIPLIDEVTEAMGEPPSQVLGDTGYSCVYTLEKLDDRGVDVLVPPSSDVTKTEKKYSLRTPKKRKARTIKDPRLLAMKERMQQPEMKQQYRKRKQTVEPVIGIIKEQMGLRQFLLRGLDGVNIEWRLAIMGYNMRRLFNLGLAIR